MRLLDAYAWRMENAIEHTKKAPVSETVAQHRTLAPLTLSGSWAHITQCWQQSQSTTRLYKTERDETLAVTSLHYAS